MIRNNKMPYEAPTLVSVVIETGNSLCQASTGEKFTEAVIYGTDWTEED